MKYLYYICGKELNKCKEMNVIIETMGKDFKDISEIKKILYKKDCCVDFSNAIVKIILTENKIKTWLFITENDLWFVFDILSKGKIFRVPKKDFDFKIEEYIETPQFAKMYIDKVTYPIVFDKTYTGNIETFTQLLNKYKQ